MDELPGPCFPTWRRLPSWRGLSTTSLLAALLLAGGSFFLADQLPFGPYSAGPYSAGQAAADESITPLPRLPKYGSRAVRLFHSRDYVRYAEAPDFWAMMPYYVSQFNERSCSVASATMVLNAIRAAQDLNSDDELITQEQLIETVGNPHWKISVGTPGGGGVSIEELGRYLRRAIEIYDLGELTVEAVRLNPERTDHLEHLRRVLRQNERTADDFLIVFFWQKELTDDPDGASGHVSPVAAFDEENDRVLIFDPDRQWYEPYWVTTEALVAGMSKVDRGTGRARGYVWIKPSRAVETAKAK